MDMQTKVIVGVVALIVIAGGVYVFTNTKQDEMMEKENMDTQKTMDDAEMMDDKEVGMMDKEKDAMSEADDMMGGVYEAYSAEKLARAETGDVVLFFHASWCPTCRVLNTDLEKNKGSIPEGVSILKVDYDTETELKKKYGVTYQHTLVQVDAEGNLIKKWSGGSELSDVLSEIQ